MNMRSMKMLVVVAVLLIVGVVVLDVANGPGGSGADERLLPELADRINDVARVEVTYPESRVTVALDGGRWVVRERDDYPADTGTLRQLLIALRDADIVERKTANPELHERLGLAAPGEGDGVGLTIAGDGFDYALVIGKVAQQDYRYVRFAADDQGWLIDRNPELPDAASGWLAAAIVDVPSSAVQSVAIEHEDGERIAFAKASAAADAFEVADIPAGRELTYPGVVNGIAGALQKLELDDVRRPPAAAPPLATTVRVTGFDGLRVTLLRYLVDDTAWFAVAADTVGIEATGDDAAAATDGEPEAVGSGDAEPAEDIATPEARAAGINARTDGWWFRVPEHKARLLERRWDDLLKAPPPTE